ncbi:MAG: hypothetical protein Q8O34_00665 [Rhodocyclaceae bacterium]|nr:hypothetical protein [Rhodocyclaceae bacterium]
MNLAPIIARIDAQCPAFKLVDGVAEFAALTGNPMATPACYVVPLSENDAGEDDLDAEYQRVAARFGVCLAAGNVRSAGGRDALDDLQSLRQSVRAALLGWAPDGFDMPVLFDRGELLAIKPGLVWWQDAYRTAYPIESQP